jgi:hypothetical protein
MGPRAGLDMVVKRKIPSPYQFLNPGLEHPIIQPVAQCYTTELSWLPLQECTSLKFRRY